MYRFEPDTGIVQIVADGFVQPNGIEFSPDLRTLYVTDTGSIDFDKNGTRPSTIYKYAIADGGRELEARRTVFAYADDRIPDGIHTDAMGNVYSSTGGGGGVSIWNQQGVLLGKMLVDGGSNNFEFVKGGMLLFNAYRMYWVGMRAEGREVAREFSET